MGLDRPPGDVEADEVDSGPGDEALDLLRGMRGDEGVPLEAGVHPAEEDAAPGRVLEAAPDDAEAALEPRRRPRSGDDRAGRRRVLRRRRAAPPADLAARDDAPAGDRRPDLPDDEAGREAVGPEVAAGRARPPQGAGQPRSTSKRTLRRPSVQSPSPVWVVSSPPRRIVRVTR